MFDGLPAIVELLRRARVETPEAKAWEYSARCIREACPAMNSAYMAISSGRGRAARAALLADVERPAKVFWWGVDAGIAEVRDAELQMLVGRMIQQQAWGTSSVGQVLAQLWTEQIANAEN